MTTVMRPDLWGPLLCLAPAWLLRASGSEAEAPRQLCLASEEDLPRAHRPTPRAEDDELGILVAKAGG